MEDKESSRPDRDQQMLEELRVAAEFQRAILPDIIDLPFLDIALLYEPFRDVSGDVYDFMLNREGELGIFVGDATGHGVVAALMTMMVHIALDNIRRNLSTDESLRCLNRMLTTRNTGRSVTGVFLRICPDGQLRTANAGHPPMIIIPTGPGNPVLFQAAGCALGMFHDEPVPYVEEQYQLHPGDKLLLYTDAVIEWRDGDNVPYGTDRLLGFVDKYRNLGCKPFSNLLLQELENHSGGRASGDDLTILTCQYLGQADD